MREVYRSSSLRPFAVSFTFVNAVVIIEASQGLSGKHIAPALAVAMIVASTMGVVWSWLVFVRMGVVTSNEGIVVRNLLRNYSISWDEVQCFKFGEQVQGLSVREEFASPYLQPYVLLKSGRHRVMSGLQISRIYRNRNRSDVQSMLDSLEKERSLHAQSGGQPT